nr:hypothetical protein [Tanacetum cinerariifolium]
MWKNSTKFMAVSDRIKERKVVHQVTSELTGQIVVDDVVYENVNGDSKSKKKGSQKRNVSNHPVVYLSSDLSVDHEYLARSYHSGIVSEFTLIYSYLERLALSGGTTSLLHAKRKALDHFVQKATDRRRGVIKLSQFAILRKNPLE